MSGRDDTVVHPATGERVTFVRTACDTGGELLEMEDVWVRADHATAPHVHPGMEERWEVLGGRVGFIVGDRELTADPGDVVVAPAGMTHHAWNLSSGPARLRIQMRPALRWEEVVRRLFSVSEPDIAALLREFPDELAAPRPAGVRGDRPRARG